MPSSALLIFVICATPKAVTVAAAMPPNICPNGGGTVADAY